MKKHSLTLAVLPVAVILLVLGVVGCSEHHIQAGIDDLFRYNSKIFSLHLHFFN